MKFHLGMVLILSLLATACGDRAGSSTKKGETGDRPIDRPAASASEPTAESATEMASESAAESATFQVREIRLTPESLLCTTPVTAEAVCSGTPPAGLVFQYEWVVNNEKVVGVTGEVLEPNHFKKKAWVSCRVVPTWPGGKGVEVRSKFVRIANSAPALTILPMEPFQAPGEFKCQLQGVDPDKDPFSFQLISPLDQGIVLDEKTGTLTWQISQEKADSMKGPVEIVFAAIDDDGGKAQGSLTIQLTAKEK